MLLGEPGRTSYDINFSLFGFPIRVHPAFFIMPLIFGSSMLQIGDNPGVALLVLTAVFFGSILFHELGHSIAFKYYGISSHIVLYWMGGVAVPNGGSYGSSFRRGRAYTSNAQIIVSLAGPAFNFILGGLLLGIIYATGGQVEYEQSGIFPILIPDLRESSLAGNSAAFIFFLSGLFANFVWGILNLIPVYPLDGGQVARQVFMQADSHNGLKNSLILSIIVAIVVGVVGLQQGDRFMPIFFGFMAYSNYMALQQSGGIGRGW